MSDTTKKILFVGGGTAGHISPLLAVMEAVQKTDDSIVCAYVGLAGDIESVLVKQSTLHFHRYTIAAGKLHRRLTLKNLIEPLRSLAGLVQALRLLKKIRPNVVFSKGGYVSVPIILAAKRLNIPVVSHETDVIPGLANQYVAKIATKICTAFPPEGYTVLPADKLVYTGQPVRSVFREAVRGVQIIAGRPVDHRQPLLTIIGGSQGARKINTLIQSMWPQLLAATQIVHICGQLDYETIQEQAERLSPAEKEKLWLLPFVHEELPHLFQTSTCVVSRAGGTIAELAATHSPTILVPLSTSSQGHQQANAKVLEKAGAVLNFDETTGTAEDLYMLIMGVLQQNAQRQNLAQHIGVFDKPHAASDIAKVLFDCLK